MIKTLRDAEIQIEDLRDTIRRLKTDVSGVDEDYVQSAIRSVVNRIRIPPVVIPNVFEYITLRRAISTWQRPELTIETLASNIISRVTRVLDWGGRLDLLVNCEYNVTGGVWRQEEPTYTSLGFSIQVDTTLATSYFLFQSMAAGATSLVDKIKVSGEGNIYPVVDVSASLGIAGKTWNYLRANQAILGTPLAVSYGGTGWADLTANKTLQGNGTSAVNLITGIQASFTVLTSATVSWSTYNWTDQPGGQQHSITYVSDVTFTTKDLVFTYGVLTAAT